MAERTIAERMSVAAIVALAAMASAAPYIYYVTKVAFADRVREVFRALPEQKILEVDLISVALAVVIAAIVGSLFSERYGFAGIGDRVKLARALPVIAIAGPLMMVVSYFVFGRPLAARVAGYFPDTFAWALAMVVKGAVFDEVVARYGMMTIAGGVARRVWLANAMQALFFTAVGLKSMAFFGVVVDELTFFLAAGLVASFVMHAVQGWVYARYGLVASIALHAVVESKHILHVLLGF